MNSWSLVRIPIFILFAGLLVGCTSINNDKNESAINNSNTVTPTQQENKESPPKNPDPVTIVIAQHIAAYSDEEFERFVSTPVKAKYPHITVKRVDFSQKGQSLEDQIAAKQTFDIYGDGVLNLPNWKFIELGLEYNMEELIKKHQFDLTRLRPEFLEAVKVGSDRDHLIGLPLYNQPFGLIYNKDLFNRMATDYPRDNMFWEDIRDIAVRMTRSDGGVQYIGLYPDNVFRGAYQANLPWLDVKNNTAVFQTEPWKELVTLWYSLYEVPGIPPKGTNFTKEFNEGRIAMISGSGGGTAKSLLQIPDLDWDVVTYPQNKKFPGIGQRVDSYAFYITSISKNKDAAFQVLEVILSDEVQRDMSLNARMSILANQNIQNQFGQGIDGFKGKNMVAFTKLKLAPLHTFKNTPAASIINTAFNEILFDGKDINTALREADEKMNLAIKERMMMNQ